MLLAVAVSVLTDDTRPNRRAVADWTLKQLYALIFSGELGSGDALVESDLTQRLGVSRSPLREALQQLERDHLVRPDDVNGRRVVTSFGVEDIAELYTVRAALESLAFEQAAMRMTTGELVAELRRVQAQMEATRDDGRAWEARNFEADFRFHELVCRAAHMPRLHSQLSTLWVQTWALLQQLHAAGVYPDAGEDAEAFSDHRALIAALETKDPQAAADAVRRHLITRRDHLVDAVDRQGGLPAKRD